MRSRAGMEKRVGGDVRTVTSSTRCRKVAHMPGPINFTAVSTEGLETSPVAEALAGLRAHEARYYKTKYDHVFTTEPAAKAKKAIAWVNEVLAERDITIASPPLEACAFKVETLRMAYVFHESGLAVNVMYDDENPKKRAVGFKLSVGMDVPDELATKFKFATQKSKLAGVVRGTYFVVKGEH